MIEMPVLTPPKHPTDRIAFFGPMCSGKTYCADYLVQQGYNKINFAGRLKEIARDIFDVRTKDGQDRTILQQLGQKMREIDTDIWIKLALKKIADNSADFPVVIDDLRYVNEAKVLRANGFLLIRVHTDEIERLNRIAYLYPNTPEGSELHSSEREWEQIVPDYTVDSETPEIAQAEIEKILREDLPGFLELTLTHNLARI